MHKKAIIFIHGGESFSNYDAFIEHLRSRPIRDPLGEPSKRWKHTLRQELGSEYGVYLPSMPNSDNAAYNEWRIWFERYLELVHDGVVLIGHSQGGYFLAKYLSEHTLPVRVAAVYLLAAPYEPDDFDGEDGGDFAFDPERLKDGASQVGQVYIFHSKDDEVVPYAHAKRYAALLPEAELTTFEDKGHFLMEEFPELIAHIQKSTS